MVTASGTLNRRQAPTENVYGAPSASPATSMYAAPLASACAMRWSRRRRSSWLSPSSVTGGHAEARSCVDLGHHVVGDVEVGVHVLHVIAVFEGVDQAEDLACAVGVEWDADRREEARLG